MLNEQAIHRYSRQLIMPEVGGKGQEKLTNAKVLIVGAGGLGSPAAYYLGAAGIGTLGLVDSDEVDLTNLQRQILHSEETIGWPKVDSARQKLEKLNSSISLQTYQQRVEVHNVEELIKDYDIVVDGCDNFRTRFIVNDACVLQRKPFVHGSVLRFQGQASVFKPFESACYRCILKQPPPPGAVPSCQEAGVLGVLPGIIGLIEAIEVVKLILGVGDSLSNRLLIFDGLELKFMDVELSRDQNCPVCGDAPSIRFMEETHYREENCELS